MAQAETISTTYDGVTSGYDNSGRVTKRSNPAGTIDTLYDLNGRETKRTTTVGGTAYAVTTKYTDFWPYPSRLFYA